MRKFRVVSKLVANSDITNVLERVIHYRLPCFVNIHVSRFCLSYLKLSNPPGVAHVLDNNLKKPKLVLNDLTYLHGNLFKLS